MDYEALTDEMLRAGFDKAILGSSENYKDMLILYPQDTLDVARMLKLDFKNIRPVRDVKRKLEQGLQDTWHAVDPIHHSNDKVTVYTIQKVIDQSG